MTVGGEQGPSPPRCPHRTPEQPLSAAQATLARRGRRTAGPGNTETPRGRGERLVTAGDRQEETPAQLDGCVGAVLRPIPAAAGPGTPASPPAVITDVIPHGVIGCHGNCRSTG